MTRLPYYAALVRELAPHAELVLMPSPKAFFEDGHGAADAFLLTAEMGSAWSLLYPQYTVAIPHPVVITAPMAYPIALGDPDMLRYLNTWVDLKQKDGTFQKVYDHWILGRQATQTPPRWSVLRDVLRWVD